jgi:hypothetical protein
MHKEMLNIPSRKGNTNQNDIEISPYFSHNGYQKQEMLVKDAGGLRSKGTLIHCW